MTDVMTAVRIGQRLINAADRPGMDVTNPADLGDIVGTVPALTPDDVAQAFAAAETAQRGWRDLGWIVRGEVLFRAAAEIRSRSEELNLPTSGWDVHHPFGGYADSGSAFKEQGREALTFYSRVKTVAVHSSFSALGRTRRAAYE